jgi:hypothetical protein
MCHVHVYAPLRDTEWLQQSACTGGRRGVAVKHDQLAACPTCLSGAALAAWINTEK